jgi:Uma2 family endonuclease
MGTTVLLTTDRKLRLTRKHVYTLLDAGLLGDARYDLIDGELIQKMPQNPSHVCSVQAAVHLLGDIFGRKQVGSQGPIVIDETNESEPDVYVLKNSLRSYKTTPTTEDVLLVVEISDSTIRIDRNAKMKLYGDAGIQEYWIVDLNKGRVIVHRDPDDDGYGSIETFTDGEISPLAAPDSSISVVELLFDEE